MRRGFTLAEILVVVGVLTVMSVIFVEIFFRSLKGGNQAQLLGVIKQNGQGAIEIMDKNIRLADNIVCVGSSEGEVENDTLLIVKEGVYSRFRFVPPTTARNGFISQDNQDDCTFGALPANLVILTNTDPNNGVSLISGSFQRNTKPGFKDIVTINFTLGPGIGVPKSLAEKIDPLEFNTAIELR